MFGDLVVVLATIRSPSRLIVIAETSIGRLAHVAEVAGADVEPERSFWKESGEEQCGIPSALQQYEARFSRLCRGPKKTQCKGLVCNRVVIQVLYETINEENMKLE